MRSCLRRDILIECESISAEERVAHMTRIGIIGLGFMGRVHYDTYTKLPEAQVVAVCDADPKRAAATCRTRGATSTRARRGSSRWTASRARPTGAS